MPAVSPPPRKLYVINPNSTVAVTDGMARALLPLAAADIDIVCETQHDGPSGVQTQQDVEQAGRALSARVAALEADPDAHAAGYVIACFSDPGLHAVRELTRKPVLGISESGVLTAMTLGQRFGVLAILQRSIARHRRGFAAMGVLDRLAGELAIDLNVVELTQRERTLARMIEQGRKLKEDHQADVLVMGCAGMAEYRQPLQEALGMPVVEPTQAAVAQAMGLIRLGWERV